MWNFIFNKIGEDDTFINYYGHEDLCNLNLDLEELNAMENYVIPIGDSINIHWENIKLHFNNNKTLSSSIKCDTVFLLEKLQYKISKFCPQKILIISSNNKIFYRLIDLNINNNFILVCQLSL